MTELTVQAGNLAGMVFPCLAHWEFPLRCVTMAALAARLGFLVLAETAVLCLSVLKSRKTYGIAKDNNENQY